MYVDKSTAQGHFILFKMSVDNPAFHSSMVIILDLDFFFIASSPLITK